MIHVFKFSKFIFVTNMTEVHLILSVCFVQREIIYKTWTFVKEGKTLFLYAINILKNKTIVPNVILDMHSPLINWNAFQKYPTVFLTKQIHPLMNNWFASNVLKNTTLRMELAVILGLYLFAISIKTMNLNVLNAKMNFIWMLKVCANLIKKYSDVQIIILFSKILVNNVTLFPFNLIFKLNALSKLSPIVM